MRTVRTISLALVFMALASTASAQAVTANDITALETTAADVARLAMALKKSDPTLGGQVERTLAELNEEVSYLKVKLRREGSVPREDYQAIRDRLETLRLKAEGGGKVTAQPAVGAPGPKSWTVPVGTSLEVRLQTPLNSGTAKVEERFEATTILDFSIGEEIVIPAGAIVRGFVSSVRPAGRIDRVGSIVLSFDELRIEGRSYRLRASVTDALDGKIGGDVTRVGTGAAIGGIIGGILGGAKGALLGVIVGGGGAIAATEGTNVDLPLGTILRIRLDQPVDIVK